MMCFDSRILLTGVWLLASVCPVFADTACEQRWQELRALPMASAYLRGERLPGVVTGAQALSVTSERAAFVVSLPARTGMRLRKGELMARLDSPELTLELRAIEREASHGRQEVIKSREELRRVELGLQRRQLHPQLFAKDELDALAASRVAAEASLRQAEDRLAQIEQRVQRLADQQRQLRLFAPADLRVIAVSTRIGAQVPAGASLLELALEREHRVRFAVPVGVRFAPDQRLCLALPEQAQAWRAHPLPGFGDLRTEIQARLLEAATSADFDWPIGTAVEVFHLDAPSPTGGNHCGAASRSRGNLLACSDALAQVQP